MPHPSDPDLTAPEAALLAEFIAEPHAWHRLQQYCEVTGRPHWTPGSGKAPAHPLDPLSELLMALTVAMSFEEEAPDGEDAGAPPEDAPPLEERCEHSFARTAAWLRDNDRDEVSAYQQLLDRDIACDHEMVEHLLGAREASLAVLVQGWAAGVDRAGVDRLVSGELVELTSEVPDPDVLTYGPLAGVWEDDRLLFGRQLHGGLDLLRHLHEAMELLREGERLVLAATFPYEEDVAPVVAASVTGDCWVIPADRRFDFEALEQGDHQRLDTLLPELERYRPPPPRAGGSLPSETLEAWIFEQLAALVERQGSEPLLRPPVVELPFDRGQLHGVDGVKQVLRFIMNASGLEPLGLHLRVVSYDDVLSDGGVAHPHADRGRALGWFEGIEDGRCIFGLDLSQHWDSDGLVGTLSHEVAHAWRHHHGLVEADHQEEELLTDLTTVYLGFGLFTTNTTSRIRTWSGLDFSSYQHVERAGYLPAVAMSFALALSAAARGGDRAEHRRLVRELETDQRSYFKAAARYLEDGDELVQELGLGPRRLRAPLSPRRVSTQGPFEPSDRVEVLEPAAAGEGVDREPVFAMRSRRPSAVTWATILAGVAGSIALARFTELGALGFLIAAAWAFVVFFAGPGTRCSLCTVCETRIEDTDVDCPGCGGFIHGRVKDGYAWLEAKERLELGDGGDEQG